MYEALLNLLVLAFIRQTVLIFFLVKKKFGNDDSKSC